MSINTEMTKIGEGTQSDVFVHPAHPDRVVKISKKEREHEAPKDVKARFYITRIFHLLFPKMVPNVHLEAVKNGQTIIVVDRVQVEEDSRRAMELFGKVTRGVSLTEAEEQEFNTLFWNHTDRLENDEEVQTFRSAIERTGSVLDSTPINFGYTTEGQAIYLDRLPMWDDTSEEVQAPLSEQKMKEIIKDFADSAENKERALKWLKRYYAIASQK